MAILNLRTGRKNGEYSPRYFNAGRFNLHSRDILTGEAAANIESRRIPQAAACLSRVEDSRARPSLTSCFWQSAIKKYLQSMWSFFLAACIIFTCAIGDSIQKARSVAVDLH
ncbi:hypothetical protein [Massilia oculi]|uniref:hypothetical protein n=1 Tax=Massilia oculi TaxID=945844 RepID=UPI0013B43187|nr:hypothetical protein [Massilia oculi]